MDIIARVATSPAPAGDEDLDRSPRARVPGALVQGPPALVPVDALSAKVLVAGSTPKIARALLEEGDYAVSDANAPNGVGYGGVQRDSQGYGNEIRMPIRAPVTADEIEDSDPEDVESDSGASYESALERMAAGSTISSQYGSPRGTPTGSIFGSEAGDSLHRRLSEVLSDEPSSNSLLDEQFRESGSEKQEVHFMPVAKVTTDEDDGQQAAGGSGYLFSDDESGDDEPMEQGLETAAGLHVAGVGEDELILPRGSQEVSPVVGTSQDSLADSVEQHEIAVGIPVRGFLDADELSAEGLPVGGAGNDVRVLPSAQGLPIAGIEPTAEGLPVAGAERTAQGFPVAGAEEVAAAPEEHSLPTAQGLPVVGAEEEFFAAPAGDALLRAGPAVAGTAELAAAPEGKAIPEVAGVEDSAVASREVSRPTAQEGYVADEVAGAERTAQGFPVAGAEEVAAAPEEHSLPTAQGLPVVGAEEEFFAAPAGDALLRAGPAVAGTAELAAAPEGKAIPEVAGVEDSAVASREVSRPTAQEGYVADEVAGAERTAQGFPVAGAEEVAAAPEEHSLPTAQGLPVVGAEEEFFAAPAGDALLRAGPAVAGTAELAAAPEVAGVEDSAVASREVSRPTAQEGYVADEVAGAERTAQGFPVAGAEEVAAAPEEHSLPTAQGFPVVGAEEEFFAAPAGDALLRAGPAVAGTAELAAAPEGKAIPEVAGVEDSAVASREVSWPTAQEGYVADEVAGAERTAQGFPVAGAEEVAAAPEGHSLPTAQGLPVVGAEEEFFAAPAGDALLRAGPAVAGTAELAAAPEGKAIPEVAGVEDSAVASREVSRPTAEEGYVADEVAGAELVAAAPEEHSLPTAQGLLVVGAEEEFFAAPAGDALLRAGSEVAGTAELAAAPEGKAIPEVAGVEDSAVASREVSRPTAEEGYVADEVAVAQEEDAPLEAHGPVLAAARGQDALPTLEGLLVAGVDDSRSALSIAGVEGLDVATAEPTAQVAGAHDLAVAPEEPRSEGLSVLRPEDLPVVGEEPTPEQLSVAEEAEDIAVAREESTPVTKDSLSTAVRLLIPDLAIPQVEPESQGSALAFAREEPTGEGFLAAQTEGLAVAREDPTGTGLPDAGPEDSSVALEEPKAGGLPVAGAENLAVTPQEPPADGLPDAGSQVLPLAREKPTAEGLPVAGAEELALAPEKDSLLTDRTGGLPDAGAQHAGAFNFAGKELTAEGVPVAGAEKLVLAPDDLALPTHSAEGLRGAGAEEPNAVLLEDAPPTTADGHAVAGLSGAEENAWPTAQGLPGAGAQPPVGALPVAIAEELVVPPEEDEVLPGAKEAHASREENASSALSSAEGLIVPGAGVAAPLVTGDHGPDTTLSGLPGSASVGSLPLHGEKKPDDGWKASPTQHVLGDNAQPTSTTQSEIEDSKYEPGSEAPAGDGTASVKQVLGSAVASKSGDGSGRADGVVTPTGGPSKHRNLAQLLYSEAAEEKLYTPIDGGQKPIVHMPRWKILQLIQSVGKSAQTKATSFAKTTLRLLHIPTVTCFSRKNLPVAQSDDEGGSRLPPVPRT